MTKQELQKHLMELTEKRRLIVEKLIEPARAAAHQMKDAGMRAGSDPLLSVLFELDAANEEITNVFQTDPKGVLTAMFDLLRGE